MGNEQALLTEDELYEWNDLVERGLKIRADKDAVKDAASEAKRIAMAAKSGKRAVWKSNWKRKKGRKGELSMLLKEPSVGVMRYILSRHGGLSAKESGVVSGTTWTQVIREYNHNEYVRAALDALYSDSKILMKEMAHSLHEQVLKGGDVSAVNARAAEWTLERVGGSEFSDPRVRAAQIGNQKDRQGGGGGIAIFVIDDAAKAAAKPLPADGATVLTDA